MEKWQIQRGKRKEQESAEAISGQTIKFCSFWNFFLHNTSILRGLASLSPTSGLRCLPICTSSSFPYSGFTIPLEQHHWSLQIHKNVASSSITCFMCIYSKLCLFFGKGSRFSRKGGPAIEQITINFEGVNEKIQMEFEQTVSALEFKLQPKVFVEYSSTPRACLGLLGLV